MWHYDIHRCWNFSKWQWALQIFQHYGLPTLVRRGDVDNGVLWRWQRLWQGLYNNISALPDWAELNEFHVITGSVCKQPRVMAEATARASISGSLSFSFSLSPSFPHSLICMLSPVCVEAHAYKCIDGGDARTLLHSLISSLAFILFLY